MKQIRGLKAESAEMNCETCSKHETPECSTACTINDLTGWEPVKARNVVILTKLMHTTDPIFLPYRKHTNDAGADLRARIDSSVLLHHGHMLKIPTGIGVSIPEGYVGLIQPRSGASSEGKLVITGTIDHGYSGEMCMNVFNPLDSNYVVINPKERIAQLVVVPYLQTEFVQVDELGESERGTAGFGSTGSM